MRLFLVFAVLAFFIAPASATAWKADPGPETVETLLGAWVDTARERTVPYKIYLPVTARGPRPVVIFSHGLGGSREAAPFLGTHLASWGYVVVFIQHPGSDRAVWEGLTDPREIVRVLTAATRDLNAVIGRFEDVPFALDQLTAMNLEGPLKGRLDMSRVGMSGHSFGAVTTLTAAGQKMGRRGYQASEPRFRAFIAYSPNKPMGQTDIQTAYEDIRAPILHFTGTEDTNPLDPSQPATDRQIPFRTIAAPGQYLIVLNGGDHGVFSGERRRGQHRDTDDLHHRLIGEASTAFWDAYLMDDAAALAWLRDGTAATELAPYATYEMRN